MALYYDSDKRKAYYFSQMFIDERYQGRGYGLAAARLILAEMEKESKYKKVSLCYAEGNDAALSFYKKLGFRLTGETEDDEDIYMEKEL